MNKIYLLLRNNKQTGPHNVEELKLLGLKTTDLIWVEGKSAGWRNPMELDTLKSYVPGLSEQIIQGNEERAEKFEIATDSDTPAIKTKGNHSSLQKHSKNIFVSLPSNFTIPDEVHEETMAEKLEKKAQELLNKVQAYSQEKNLEKNDEVADIKYPRSISDVNEEYPNWRKQQIEKNDSNEPSWKGSGLITKFSGSLNEIKEEYSSWLKEQKEKTVIGKKSLMAAAFLIAVVAFAFFKNSFNQKMTSSDVDHSTSTLPADTKIGDMADRKEDTLNFEEDYLPDASFFSDQMNKDQNKSIEETPSMVDPKAVEASPVDAPSVQEPILQEKKEPITEVIRKDDRKLQTSTPQPPEKKDETSVTDRKNEPVIQTASSKKEKPSVPLTQLINISGDYLPSQKGDGVNGYRVTMQNNSEQLLKVVAVDVLYYAANDKLLNKKTLYFSNVTAGANMILTAPSNKDAVAVTHQLGLVSSEEGAIYVVKQ
jgi:hypothetical protein